MATVTPFFTAVANDFRDLGVGLWRLVTGKTKVFSTMKDRIVSTTAEIRVPRSHAKGEVVSRRLTGKTAQEVREAAKHVVREHRAALDWLADR